MQQRLEATNAALESDDEAQLAGLTKHDLVGDLLYGTIFSYFALNNFQDEIAARSANVVTYRLPSYGTFSTSLQTRYWFGIPRNVSFAGLTMDVDRASSQRVSRSNNPAEALAFSQARGARMSAMTKMAGKPFCTAKLPEG